MKKLFLTLIVITVLFAVSSLTNTNKAEAYYSYTPIYFHYYVPTYTYYAPNIGEQMQLFDNNLWNIENTYSEQVSQIQTNFELQEIINKIGY